MGSTYNCEVVAEADKLFGQGGRHFENYFLFIIEEQQKIGILCLEPIVFNTINQC